MHPSAGNTTIEGAERGPGSAVALAALGAASALFAAHHVAAHAQAAGPPGVLHVLFTAVAQWAPWLAAAPVVVHLVRRHGRRALHGGRDAARLAAAGVGVSFGTTSLEYWIRRLSPTDAAIAPAATWPLFVGTGLAFALAVFAFLAIVALLVELGAAPGAARRARRPEAEPEPLPSVAGPAEVACLQVDVSGRIRFLSPDDIDWIEAAGNYVVLHAGREAHVYSSSLRALESRLDRRRFVRVHRSAVVNVTRVLDMAPWSGGDYRLTLKDGTVLRLSRTYRRRFDLVTGRPR